MSNPGDASRSAPGLAPIARRWWWLILGATVVAAVAGHFLASRADPAYESRARVLVGPYEADLDTIRASTGLVQTYAGIVTSDHIVDAAAVRVGVSDLDDVVESIHVTGNDVTRVVSIRVTASDADMAANVANALAAELGLITAPSDLVTGSVTILDVATPSTAPVAPQVTLITAVAAMIGLVVGLAAALVLERQSDRLRDHDEITRVSGLPVLGEVSLVGDSRTDPASMAAIAGPSGASLRFVLSRIAQGERRSDEPFRSLAVVPLADGARTAAFARGLALTVASTGRPTLLLSNRPAAGDREELRPPIPLSSLLTSNALLGSDSMVTVRRVDLDGPMPIAPEAVPGALAAIADATGAFVMLDLGSVDQSVGSLVLPSAADAVVIVAEQRRVRRRELARVVDALGGATGVLCGLALLRRSTLRAPRLSQDVEPAVPSMVSPASRASA